MPGKDDAKGPNSLSWLNRELVEHSLSPFLSIADIATGMKPSGKWLHFFLSNKKIYQNRLEKIGVQPQQIDSLDLKTLEVITSQLEALKKNSPHEFQEMKQNYLDTGIPCPAIFSLQVDERSLSADERRDLSDKAAQYNNVALLNYLSSDARGTYKTPLRQDTLVNACFAANLPLIKALLDPAANRIGSGNTRTKELVTAIAKSQNFSVMLWILETLVDEPGNPALKQKIQENMPLDSGLLIQGALYGGNTFYTQLVAFIHAYPNNFPELMESLPVANYYNNLINNRGLNDNEVMDDFNWISNTDDPRLNEDQSDAVSLIWAVLGANNLQLVVNFFEAIKNNIETSLKLPLIGVLQIALISNCDLTILEFTYKKLLEEFQHSLPNGAEIIDINEAFKTDIENSFNVSFDDYFLMRLSEHKNSNSDFLAGQLRVLNIKPTIWHVALAVDSEAYHLAATLCSDSMGKNKVTVTREALREIATENQSTFPSDAVIDKLFHLESDSPALRVS